MTSLSLSSRPGLPGLPSRPNPSGEARKRPRVKICGVTDAGEASLAIDLGAELIGLNFYAKSPRYLAPERAAELVEAVGRERATWVGVFVNDTADTASAIADRVGLDLLQFHGDEPPEALRDVAPVAIKALRVEGDATAQDFEPWLGLGLWGLLFDARHGSLYGGSGRSWNFASLAAALDTQDAGATQHADSLAVSRLLIAGGLAPHNVRDAARVARPWGVDLCSGVESTPGRKDPQLLRRLFTQLDEEITHG